MMSQNLKFIPALAKKFMYVIVKAVDFNVKLSRKGENSWLPLKILPNIRG